MFETLALVACILSMALAFGGVILGGIGVGRRRR